METMTTAQAATALSMSAVRVRALWKAGRLVGAINEKGNLELTSESVKAFEPNQTGVHLTQRTARPRLKSLMK